MKEIVLTNGCLAFVDDEDFDRLSAFRWTAHKSTTDGAWYVKRFERTSDGVVKNIYMHRDILGALAHQEVDHKDRNGLNNTKSNLRLCTKSQNNANIRRRRPASGFSGVYFDPKCSRPWIARCWVGGRSNHLGCFSDATSAAIARDAFVRDHWGEFAVLNFPERAS